MANDSSSKVKPKYLDGFSMAGFSTAHKPLPLNISRWDTD